MFFNFFRKSSKSGQKKQDLFQKRQEARLHKVKLQEEEQRTKYIQNDDKSLKVDLDMQIPTTFSEARKKVLLTFFIKHFIACIKKSNEFRAYGQSLMLVLQSQNLVKLLDELGYGKTPECSEFKVELERLKSISRVGTEGYWKVNWGCSDSNNNTNNSNLLRRTDSSNRQQLPLPDLPSKTHAPILGTETPVGEEEEASMETVFVEVHDMPDDSTNL